jgi:hypothetical protein
MVTTRPWKSSVMSSLSKRRQSRRMFIHLRVEKSLNITREDGVLQYLSKSWSVHDYSYEIVGYWSHSCAFRIELASCWAITQVNESPVFLVAMSPWDWSFGSRGFSLSALFFLARLWLACGFECKEQEQISAIFVVLLSWTLVGSSCTIPTTESKWRTQCSFTSSRWSPSWRTWRRRTCSLR